MTARSKTLDYDVAIKVVALKAEQYVAPRKYAAVSFDAAVLLCTHHSRISFPGLRRVSPRVASGLAKVKGVLALNGLRHLPKSVARALAAHEGKLILRRLVSLDTETLETLAGHAGPVLMPAFRPSQDDDRRQRQILARHGNLRYDPVAVDVFEGMDFTRYRWNRAPAQ